MQTEFRKKLADSIVALVLGLIALAIGAFVIFGMQRLLLPKPKDNTQKIEDIAKDTQQIKKQITPYEYKDGLIKIVLVENFTNSTAGQKPTSFFEKYLQVNGTLKDGFLYIKANINGAALDTKSDIYTKLSSFYDNKHHEYGGHLIKEKSLDIPVHSDYSEFLYKLSDVKYKGSFTDSDIEITSADWLSLLNIGSNQRLVGFSSSVDNGTIAELSFYYSCAEGTQCSVTLK